jgi:ribosomal protein S18 acetylase RimI-like enzyme
MDVQIRAATEDDVAAVAGLLATVTDLHAAVLPHIYRPVADEGQFADYIRGLMATAEQHVVVAERGGEIAGYVSFSRRPPSSVPFVIPHPTVNIDSVVVAERFQRQGIGAALVTWVHDWAAAHGISHIDLGVAAFNAAALRLYEKLGYTTVWHRMRYQIPERSPADCR